MKQEFEDEVKVKEVKKRGRKKGTITQKVLMRKARIMEIFKDRFNFKKGLTKLELISLFINKPMSSIVKFDEEAINHFWKDICDIKKVLRKELIMGIISEPFERGVILKDNVFGERILKRRTFVFWRCTTWEDAEKYKGVMDKIAIGVNLCGEETAKIVELNEGQRIAMPQIIQR